MALRMIRGAQRSLPGPLLAWSEPGFRAASTASTSTSTSSTTNGGKSLQKPRRFWLAVNTAGFALQPCWVARYGGELAAPGYSYSWSSTMLGVFDGAAPRPGWLLSFVQTGALPSRPTEGGQTARETPAAGQMKQGTTEQEQKMTGQEQETAEREKSGGQKQDTASAQEERDESADTGTEATEKAGIATDAESGMKAASSGGEDKLKPAGFRVETDVSGFEPDEVTVTVSEGAVTLEAAREEVTDTGRMSRRLYRRFTLPERVQPAQVTVTRTEDGVMVVEAPLDE